jgi:anti-sigma28 factor (negative regulator of flagellin synthesis)
MEKLASIQAAIAAGNYDVPAAAVATKVIDALLGGQK